MVFGGAVNLLQKVLLGGKDEVIRDPVQEVSVLVYRTS
jgi:hypothetical protein